MPIPMVKCPEHGWARAITKSECSQCALEKVEEDSFLSERLKEAISLLYKWRYETNYREELKRDTLNFLLTEDNKEKDE